LSTTTTRPVALDIEPSFGFGDRLGNATPGHLAALEQAGGPIRGIFAQQSIREMTRTARTAGQVMTCAAVTLETADYHEPWGADADHLKTTQDVDVTAEAGFVFFTIDPSDHVDQQADNYDATALAEKYQAVREQCPWVADYAGQTIKVSDNLTLELDEAALQRAAVKYGRALVHAIDLAGHIRKAARQRKQEYEIEISVDETDQPTTLAEHYIIADQLLKADVKLVSLAPRFIGELEKGVDYKGDLGDLERSLHNHAAIARHLGPYKLSLHSGSDKLSMYAPFARATRGLFHVKTAGTSYLEALRAVLRHDEPLFREIVDFSRDRYPTDKATYHVSATNESVPPATEISSAVELEQVYLERWQDVPTGQGFTAPGRQILHCTFGSVLTHETLGDRVRQLLEAQPDTYTQVLTEHFARHLKALRAGM